MPRGSSVDGRSTWHRAQRVAVQVDDGFRQQELVAKRCERVGSVKLGEVLKTALIGGEELFQLVEQQAGALDSGDAAAQFLLHFLQPGGGPAD